MPALKCPNPSCPFLFDPTQVPPGAILTCPRCAMRFTLGPTPGEPPPGGSPLPPGYGPPPQTGYPSAPPGPTQTVDYPAGGYAPTAEFPISPPTTTVEPQPGPAPALPVASRAEPRRDEAEPARPRRSGGYFGILAVAGGIMLLFGIIAGAIVVSGWVKSRGGNGTAGGELRVEDKNFAYRFPDSPWERDPDTQNALGVHAFALRRTEPEAWAALEVSDYGERSPLQNELQAKMTRHLEQMFGDLTLEPYEPAKWAGHDARRCQFRGRQKSTDAICVGECFLLSYKGIGYWFFTWAAERDAAAVADEFEDLRKRFRTLDLRNNWSDRVGAEFTYRSPNPESVSKYRLSNFEKIWAAPPGLEPRDENPDPKRLPNADLVLVGKLKGRHPRDIAPEARLVVLVVKEPGEAAEVAKKLVRARHTLDPELFGPTQITELTSEPAGDEPIGPEGSGIATFRLKVSPGGANASRSAEKLVVYSGLRVGDEVVVAEGSCPWSQRTAWERRLIQLVGSLKP